MIDLNTLKQTTLTRPANQLPSSVFTGDLGEDLVTLADLIWSSLPCTVDTLPEHYKPYFAEVLIRVLQSQNIDRTTFLAAWDGIVKRDAQ